MLRYNCVQLRRSARPRFRTRPYRAPRSTWLSHIPTEHWPQFADCAAFSGMRLGTTGVGLFRSVFPHAHPAGATGALLSLRWSGLAVVLVQPQLGRCLPCRIIDAARHSAIRSPSCRFQFHDGRQKTFRSIMDVIGSPVLGEGLPSTLPEFAEVFAPDSALSPRVRTLVFGGPGAASYQSQCQARWIRIAKYARNGPLG